MRILLLFFLTLNLYSRDNPFFPTDPSSIPITTSNRVENLPNFTSQTMSLPNSARAIKAITITYQNIDGSLENETLSLNNKIDWHSPIIITHKQKPKFTKKSKSKAQSQMIKLDFIKMQTTNKTMKIKTEDILIRNFMITNPYRLVMDFSNQVSFRPKEFPLNKAPFIRVRMGAHNKYYRVVIELDGPYEYSLLSTNNEMNIVFK